MGGGWGDGVPRTMAPDVIARSCSRPSTGRTFTAFRHQTWDLTTERVWVAGHEARGCSADCPVCCFAGCLTCRRFAAGRMPGLRRTPVRPRVALPTGPVLRSRLLAEGGQSASSEAAPICRQGCLRYGGDGARASLRPVPMPMAWAGEWLRLWRGICRSRARCGPTRWL